MNIKLSQQVSATYARNHFKEVTDKAIKEGMCVIMRKSKPVTVVLPIVEYEKIKTKAIKSRPGKIKKITMKELRKDSTFDKHVGSMKDVHPELSSVEIAKKWTDYVD